MGDWQPIETAPKDRGSYLVHCPDRMNTYIVTWIDSEAWGEPGWFHYGGGGGHRLTEAPAHWMPLPEPPVSRSERTE